MKGEISVDSSVPGQHPPRSWLTRAEHFLAGILPLGAMAGFLLLAASSVLTHFSGYQHVVGAVKEMASPAESIFLAIVTESVPFVLAGALVSSLIHAWISEERLIRWLPASRTALVPLTGLLGFFLPVCDCGTLPVARSLLQKGLPPGAVASFVLAAPVLNPVSVLATYTAFGMDLRFALIRVAVAFAIACAVGWAVHVQASRRVSRKQSPQGEEDLPVILELAVTEAQDQHNRVTWRDRFRSIVDHTMTELFEIVGFLIFSAAVAAVFQVYHTQHGGNGNIHTGPVAVASMMALAILFSLCSEADAFVARSFSASYAPGAVLAFLLIGQMADLRNLFLFPRTFGKRNAILMIGVSLLLCFLAGIIVA
jgi:uncharacterized membrane protein YraQ (UPF0718 family)